MSQEYSAEDLEAARILWMLPHLIWEAQHPRPCTHSLRWGARKKRSTGTDELARPPPTHSPAAAAPPPPPPSCPLHHPAASPPAPEKSNKKRSEHHAKPCPSADTLVEKATAAAAVCSGSYPSVPETASPETPLDFCRIGEEPGAIAKTKPRPPHEGLAPTKRPKWNHSHREQLTERIDLLVQTRTELLKEAAEARSRLAAERLRYSELAELRVQLEASSYRRHQHPQRQQQQQQRLLFGRSCFDPVPRTCGVGSSPRAGDHALRRKHSHEVQHLWPKPWPHGCPVAVQPVAGFSAPPQSTAPAGRPHCSWVTASHPPGIDGSSPDGSRTCKIPDLNARAEDDLSWS